MGAHRFEIDHVQEPAELKKLTLASSLSKSLKVIGIDTDRSATLHPTSDP